MKKFVTILLVVLIGFIMSFMSSCSKDEQPRYVKLEIMPRSAQKIVQAEESINRDRSTNNPSAYDSLATYWANEVWLVIQDEMPSTIDQVVGTYDQYWREHSPKYQSTVWVRIDVGCDIEMYRTCPAYSEALLEDLHEYCQSIVNGGYEWVSGERIPEKEEEIKNLFVYDPDPMVEWQYKARLYDYFLRYAQNPNAKAKYKKNGFLNFGWGQ